MKKTRYQSMGGLKVKNGRLVNDREVGKTGIQEMCDTKKMIKRNKKVSMIADGVMRGEMMGRMFDMD